MSNELRRVTNDKGREFNVRVVQRGERYGRNDVIVHDEDDPLVEFYDATYENNPGFADFMGRGQFVSRYYLSTLDDERYADYGITLQGDEPVWTINAQNRRDATAFAHRVVGAAS